MPLPPLSPKPSPAGPDAAFLHHGGRLGDARRRWPGAPRPWIDLSTGVSPFAYPAPRAAGAMRRRLPDPDLLGRLEAVAAAAFGVCDARCVVATAGAETALRLLPRLSPATTVRIAAPTYGGHAQAWSEAGACVLPYTAADAPADGAVVLVNPNNPDGRCVELATLVHLADRLGARGGWLVVDESFGEASPHLGMAPFGHPSVVVLRSFGKAYGLPGVRLGFLIAEPGVAASARRRLGEWPVSADALAAGLAAYADPAWLERTRRRWGRTARWLDRELERSGFEPAGGTSLFRLVRAEDARDRFGRLCAQGVLTRPFEHDATLLRFGLPHPRVQARVARALQATR